MRKLTRPFGKGEVVSSILTGSTRYSRKISAFSISQLRLLLRHGTKHEDDVGLVQNPRGLIGVKFASSDQGGENAGPSPGCIRKSVPRSVRRWCRSASAAARKPMTLSWII